MTDLMKEKDTDPLLAKLGEQLEKNPPELTGTERIIAGVGEDVICASYADSVFCDEMSEYLAQASRLLAPMDWILVVGAV